MKFKVSTGCYKRDIHIVWRATMSEVKEVVRENIDDKVLAKAVISRFKPMSQYEGKFLTTENGFMMIAIPCNSLSVLSHELNHAAIEVLDVAGIPITKANEEALTYLQEHLMRQALEHVLESGDPFQA